MEALFRNLSSNKELIAGLTLRQYGVSKYPNDSLNMARYIDDSNDNVTTNYKLLAKDIDISLENWILPIQKHGTEIIQVTSVNKGSNVYKLSDSLNGVDGLWTTDSNILLAMCFADCTPIYFYSDSNKFIALIHAGWRGTVGGIQLKLLDIYRRNYEIESLKVIIGPSICKKCYQVSFEIIQKFLAMALFKTDYYEQIDLDTYQLDIAKFNYYLLCQAGVNPDNIIVSGECTSCNHEQYFSYRKEQGKTGRMLGFIGRK